MFSAAEDLRLGTQAGKERLEIWLGALQILKEKEKKKGMLQDSWSVLYHVCSHTRP